MNLQGKSPSVPLTGNQQAEHEGTGLFRPGGLDLVPAGGAARRPASIGAGRPARTRPPENAPAPPYRGKRAHTDPDFGQDARRATCDCLPPRSFCLKKGRGAGHAACAAPGFPPARAGVRA